MQEIKLQTGRDGRLSGRLWVGDTESVGVVVVIHGLGDHSASYHSLACELTASRWALFAFDLPGHGASPGRRGSSGSFDGLLTDIGHALADARSRLGQIPHVLLGHSMGGNLAINFAIRQQQFAVDRSKVGEVTQNGSESAPSAPPPLDGLVLLAPMLLPPTPPPRPHIFAAWLTGHVLPRWRVHGRVDVSRLTSDPQQAAAMAADPHRHASITIYLATQLLSQGRWAIDHARELTIPTMLMFGESDDLIDRAACEHLPIRIGSHATKIRWPNKRHALLQDQPQGEVTACLLQWLSRLESSASESLAGGSR